MPQAEYIKAVLLGVLQGVAEFLPISSSGHLVIAESLMEDLGFQFTGAPDSFSMNIALHAGTLLSILVVYRGGLVRVLTQPRLLAAVILATLPVVVTALFVHDAIDAVFENPMAAGCGLLLTSLLLVVGQKCEPDEGTTLDNVSALPALAIGVFQAVALMPGVSRSGSTIAAGMMAGVERRSAADFSFLIAIPAICGAVSLAAVKILAGEGEVGSYGVMAVGAGTSFVVGLAALRIMLRVVVAKKLHWFAAYCAAAAIATITWQLIART